MRGTDRVFYHIRGFALWIFFVTVALVLAGYWFYRAESRRIQVAKFEDLASIASLKIGQILEWRRELKSDVERSTKSTYFRDAAARQMVSPGAPQQDAVFLQRLKVETLVDFYVDVLLLRPDCSLLLSVRKRDINIPAESRNACQRAVEFRETGIGELHKAADGTIEIDAVAPLENATGGVFAVLVLRSDARSYLFPLLASWPTPSKSAETLLVQRDGETVLFLNELRHRPNAALNLRVPLSSSVPAAHVARGKAGIVHSEDYRGIDVLADVRPVPSSPWFMVSKVDASEILAELRFRAMVSFAAVGLLGLLAAASLAFGYKYQQQVSRRAALEVQAARLRLVQLGSECKVEELLERALTEAIELTKSRQGFFHTLEADGATLELEAWFPSGKLGEIAVSATEKQRLTGTPSWIDSIRQGRPVIVEGSRPVRLGTESNDAHRTPSREAVVPVFRDGKVMAVLGVANKARRYTGDDQSALTQLAELTWDIVSRRRAATHHSRLEEQLRLAQRMEAIGRLAGGVAHDFNNLLLVIQACSDFLLSDMPGSDPRRGDVEEIQKAGERAAMLTRQLLAFSRKQMLLPSIFNLNDVVGGMVAMLERLLGETMTIRLQLSAHALTIKADKGQIEQVITNLVVNARDAMPGGGVITIETGTCHDGMAPTASAEREVSCPCALLSIADTGHGMDEEVKKKIFDPFFSTKAQGKGTGLGLATVYGIVRQSGGTIWVNSESGHGTSFRICLPLTDEVSQSGMPVRSIPPRGTEKLLLVEDNESVRDQIHRILTRAGYHVTTASSGDEVLSFTREQLSDLTLVVSDVVMPGIGGCELAERLLGMYPELKILLMSGYTDQADVLAGELGPGIHFIAKPFGADALARKVREVILGSG